MAKNCVSPTRTVADSILPLAWVGFGAGLWPLAWTLQQELGETLVLLHALGLALALCFLVKGDNVERQLWLQSLFVLDHVCVESNLSFQDKTVNIVC